MDRKWLLIPFAALLCLSCTSSCNNPKSEAERFEGVHRAAVKIYASTGIGINYQEFGDLVRNLATEIAILKSGKEIGSIKGKLALEAYTGVLEAYADSLKIWEAKIANSADFGGMVFAQDVERFIVIVEEYKLPTVPVKLFGRASTRLDDADRCIRIIWTNAEVRLHVAEGFLK